MFRDDLNIAGQSQFRLKNCDAVNGGRGAGLDEIAKPASDCRHKLNGFAGPGGSKDFHSPHGGKFEVFKGRDLGITLRDAAGQLRGGFDEQNAGKQRLGGEMSFEERFITAHGVFARAGFAGIQSGQAIKEAEFRTVGQGGEGFVSGGGHIWNSGLPLERLDNFVAGQVRIEKFFVNVRIQLGVSEKSLHGRAVLEFHFSRTQSECVSIEADGDLRHELARSFGFGLQGKLVHAVGNPLGKDVETRFDFGTTAGKSCVEQGQGIFELAGLGAGERITLGALEPGIDDQKLVGLADGDCLRGIAELPMKTVGCLKPNVAGRSQRLRQGFKRANLGNIGRPRLNVGLGGEPIEEKSIGVRLSGSKAAEQRPGSQQNERMNDFISMFHIFESQHDAARTKSKLAGKRCYGKRQESFHVFPQWNEVIPLIQMFADGRFEGADDLLGEAKAFLGLTECAAVVINGGQNVRRVTVSRVRQIDWKQYTTRSAGQFGGGDGCRERTTEQLNRDLTGQRGTVHEKRNRHAFLEPPDNLNEGEHILADDKRFNIPAGARCAAQLRQAVARFGERDDLEVNATFCEERTAKFPIAEVRSQEKDSTILFLGGNKMLPAGPVTKQIVNGHAAFVAPEVGNFKCELTDHLVAFAFGGLAIAIQRRQKIFDDDPAAMRREVPVDISQQPAGSGAKPRRKQASDTESDAPQSGAVERRRRGAWFATILAAGKFSPPERQQVNGDKHVASDPDGTNFSETGHPGVGGERERTKTSNRCPAAQQKRPTDSAMGRGEVAVMTAKRQLHEDAVVHAGTKHQRQRHQVEQVP
jgi:hypothetical protein